MSLTESLYSGVWGSVRTPGSSLTYSTFCPLSFVALSFVRPLVLCPNIYYSGVWGSARTPNSSLAYTTFCPLSFVALSFVRPLVLCPNIYYSGVWGSVRTPNSSLAYSTFCPLSVVLCSFVFCPSPCPLSFVALSVVRPLVLCPNIYYLGVWGLIRTPGSSPPPSTYSTLSGTFSYLREDSN